MQSIYAFSNDDPLEWVMESIKIFMITKEKKSAFANVNERMHDWS